MKYLWLPLISVLAVSCQAYECGIKNTESEMEGKVMGGTETDKNEYPWQVSLQYQYVGLQSKWKSGVNQRKWLRAKHYCGGSLIDPSWVVTAAHCVDGMIAKNVLVKAGKHDISRFEASERSSDVELIIPHENWGIHTAENDIALLKLKRPFDLSKSIGTICLPEQGQNTSGLVTVTGWGATKSDSPLSDVLMEVDVPTVTDETCRKEYSVQEISSSMICAGYQEGGFDSCQGDSGGPMIAPRNESSSYYLAGIVSWGEGCGQPLKPGVYTEVAYYHDWIIEHMTNSTHT